MKDDLVTRDERTLAVENSSYRWAYNLFSFGLLVIIGVRAWVWDETNWDLWALVIGGGAVATLYQASHRVLTRRWMWVAIRTVLAAAAIAALLVLARWQLR